MENKKVQDGKKTISTRVIAVHTAASTVDLMLSILDEMCTESPGFLKIIPSRKLTKAAYKRILDDRQKRIENTPCVTVYGINPEVMELKRVTNVGATSP